MKSLTHTTTWKQLKKRKVIVNEKAIDSESGNVVVLSSAFVAGEKQRRKTKGKTKKAKKRKKKTKAL